MKGTPFAMPYLNAPGAKGAKSPRIDPRREFDTLSDSVMLDARETAAVLGLSPNTLKMWRFDGMGPRATKLGKAVRFSAGDIRTWLKECRDASCRG